MSSDTAAIEWTSRAGVEYKAIHSEDCSLCEYAFGDELCRNSPPCEDKKRADGVSIAWVAKRHPLDVTIPDEDFPAPPDDDDDDEDEFTHSYHDRYLNERARFKRLREAAKKMLEATHTNDMFCIMKSRDELSVVLTELGE